MAQQFVTPLKYPDSGIKELVAALTKNRRELEGFINSWVVTKEVDGTVNLRLYVKTTTGHPSPLGEGYTYVNTFDNGVFTFADSAWRTLVSW